MHFLTVYIKTWSETSWESQFLKGHHYYKDDTSKWQDDKMWIWFDFLTKVLIYIYILYKLVYSYAQSFDKIHPHHQTLLWYSFLNTQTRSYYRYVIMGAMASRITGASIVYSTVSGADQRKHQSSASLPLRWEFTGNKGPVTREMFPFDDESISKEGQYWRTWMDSYHDRPTASEASWKSWIELVTTPSWWRHQMKHFSCHWPWKLWCFLWSAPEQTVEKTIETPSRSLWRHWNDHYLLNLSLGNAREKETSVVKIRSNFSSLSIYDHWYWFDTGLKDVISRMIHKCCFTWPAWNQQDHRLPSWLWRWFSFRAPYSLLEIKLNLVYCKTVAIWVHN